MPSEKITKILNSIIESSFYLLFLFVPLVMTPWNFELFEFNKMMLTYALTVVIVGAWLGKMILEKKFIFKRSPFDIPLIIYLSTQLLSTIFSLDRHTSFFGYYSRFHGGLLSTIAYLLLYWAFVSNFNKTKTLAAIRYLLAAATLVALYGILEHFGIDAQFWVQDVRSRVFSTIGQPNWLAAWLAALLPLGFAFGIRREGERTREQEGKKFFSCLLAFLLFFLFISCLFFTKSRSGIPAALLGLFFFFLLFFSPRIFSLKKTHLFSFALTLVLLFSGSLFWGLKKFPHFPQDVRYILDLSDKVNIHIQAPGEGGSSTGDIRKVVWRGAIKIFKAYPLFGSGVETFAYSYYQFRPIEHNFLSEWDFLYNKAHNEYLNFLATTGAFGLGAYLLLIGWVVGWNFKVIRDTQDETRKEHITYREAASSAYHILHISLFAGWSSILITNFFGFSVVPVALLFFLYPAMSVVLTRAREQESKRAIPNMPYPICHTQYAILLLVLFAICYLLFAICRMWYADTLFAKGNKLNKQGLYDQAFNSLKEAVSLNPAEPLYHDELAWNAANLSLLAFDQKQATSAAELAQLALTESDEALKTSPKHLNFLKTRVKIFYKFSNLDPSFSLEALKTLLQARELAPTDAKIAYNLGLIYYQLGQRQEALETLQKTLEMKPNYLEAKNALETISAAKTKK